MAKIHKSSTVYLDSDKPVVLHLQEIPAALCKKALGQNNLASLDFKEPAATADAQAEQILQAAGDKAQQIISEAVQEADRIKNAAYAEGLNLGQMKAQKDNIAFEEGLRQAVYGQLDDLRQQNVSLLAEMEASLLELSLKISEKILNQELARNHSAFIEIVHEAVNRFKPNEKLNIHISNNDYWRSMISSPYAQSGKYEQICLISDENLPDGSCLIESGSGILDASVGIQMAHIRSALEENS